MVGGRAFNREGIGVLRGLVVSKFGISCPSMTLAVERDVKSQLLNLE